MVCKYANPMYLFKFCGDFTIINLFKFIEKSNGNSHINYVMIK